MKWELHTQTPKLFRPIFYHSKRLSQVVLIRQDYGTKHRIRLGKRHRIHRLFVSRTTAFCTPSLDTGDFLYQMHPAVVHQCQAVVLAVSISR